MKTPGAMIFCRSVTVPVHFKAGFGQFTNASAEPPEDGIPDALTPCKRSFFHELVWVAV